MENDFESTVDKEEKKAESFYKQGEEYLQNDNYTLAIEEYKKVIQLMPNHALAINGLGVAYFLLENYTLAEEHFLKAKDIWIQTVGKEHLNYATSLNNLGGLYNAMNNFTLAESFYLEAKNIKKKILGKEHPDYATSLNYLGMLYQNTGNYSLAEISYLDAIDIMKKTLGKEHPDYAQFLINLSALYLDMENHASAETMLLEAKNILEKDCSNEYPHYVSLLFQLTMLYKFIGDFSSAEKCIHEAKNILEKKLGKDHSYYTSTLAQLGSLNKSKEDYDTAEKYFIEVRDICEKIHGKEHLHYADAINNLGTLYKAKEDYDKAEKYFIEAKNIWGRVKGEEFSRERVKGEEYYNYILLLNNLGVVYKSKAEYDTAEKYFLKAKSIWERTKSKEDSLYTMLLCNLSFLYLFMGEYIQALKLKQEVDFLTKELIIRNFSYLSEQQRNNYWNSKMDSLETGYLFSYYHPTLETNSLNYDNTLFIKGILLRAANAVRTSIYDSGDQDLIDKFEKLRQLRQQINVLLQSSDEKETYIQSLELEADTLDKSLTQASEFLRKYRADFELGWKDVQNNLQTNEAAVEFVSFRLFDNKWTLADKKWNEGIRYAALILRSSDDAPKWVNLCMERSLEELFTKLGDHTDQEKTEIIYGVYGAKLFAAVWQPLEKTLEGINTVYYSLSGLLHKISFNTIPLPTGECLIDKYNMQLVSSTREVVYWHNKNNEKPESAVIYGGLLYDLSTERMKEEAAPYQNHEIRPSTDLPKDVRGNKGEYWIELFNSKHESKFIHDQLMKNKIHTDLYTGAKGNKESFKALDRKKIGIFHLSTHGFFIEDLKNDNKIGYFEQLDGKRKAYENPLMRSGLALAGANNILTGKPVVGVENGVLFANDIAKMNLLGAELVVLSACDTGLGEIKNGEGVFGLQRAFKLAGAETIIMSLWAVDDKFTSKFMVKFYEKWLNEKSKQEAFQETQKDMRTENSSPYYWAAFVMMD